MFVSRRLFLFGQLCALIGLLLGCSSQEKPSKEEIVAHLKDSIAPQYKIVELDYKNFASKQQEGAGRTSISGTVELTEDLYSASNDIIKADLGKSGITAEQAMPFYPRGLRNNAVYFVSEGKGKRIEFSDEISYAETTEGFTLSGTPRINVTGRPRGELHRNSLVKGSPEYIATVDSMKAKYQAFEKRQSEIKQEIERFLSGSQPLTYRELRKGELNDRFLLRVESPIEWSSVAARGAPMGGGSSLYLFYRLNGVISWITDGRLGNSHFKAHEVTPVLITGGIYGSEDARVDWRSNIGISAPDTGQPDGFSHVQDKVLNWKETEFQWGRMADGTARGRLVK